MKEEKLKIGDTVILNNFKGTPSFVEDLCKNIGKTAKVVDYTSGLWVKLDFPLTTASSNYSRLGWDYNPEWLTKVKKKKNVG